MRRLVACALLLSGCSAGAGEETPTPFTPAVGAAVSLRNDADVPIVYFAVGEGSLALIATPRTLLPYQYEGRLVAPGETVPVTDILGYHDALGVSFHVWLVDQDADEARYRGVFLATASELARDGGLVTYSDAVFRPRPGFDRSR